MKRIALIAAALALSAGAAFAAAPASTPSATPTAHKTHAVKAMQNDVDAKRMTKALNILEAKGYPSFNNFRADGSNFSATVAQQDGHQETVVVNPDSGQVSVQS